MTQTNEKKPIPIRMRPQTPKTIHEFRKDERLDTLEEAILTAISKARAVSGAA